MKKITFFLCALLFSMMSFAAEVTYEHLFESGQLSTGNVTLTDVSWATTMAGSTYYGWSNDKGIQIGKSAEPCSSYSLTTSDFSGKILKVLVNASTANGSDAKLSISVAGTSYLTDTALTTTPTDYTATGDAIGELVISITNTQKAFYLKSITVTYEFDGEIVESPVFSVTEANFTAPFDVIITSVEGTTLKYTLDNTDPKTSSTAVELTVNADTISIPAKSTAIKAIAIKGELVSATKSMVYCFINTPETAYTVLEAMSVVDAGLGLSNELYIKGEVSEVESFNDKYGSITYWIKDEAGNKFQCYSGLGLNKEKFTSKDDLKVGSKVVVCGKMKKFDSTYELDYNNYIVSIELPAPGEGEETPGEGEQPGEGETPGDGKQPGEGETPGEGEEPGEGETPSTKVTFDFTTAEGLGALGIAYPTTDAGNGAFATDLEEGKAYTQEGVSLAAKHGSTHTRVWLTAKGVLDLRHYKTGVLTFTAPAAKVITSIVFDGGDLAGLTTLTDNAWTGNATTVEIPAADDAKTIKINTITISLTDASEDYVVAPTIAGETNFLDSTLVTITAAEGLKVYYTLDGTEPTNASTEYTAPFQLTATATVKAIAYNGDKASAVVSKTFTKMSILTCEDAVALCTATATTEKYIIRGYVTGIVSEYDPEFKNMSFWMADAADGGQVLQAFRVKPVSEVEQGLQVGDFVEVTGTLVLYNSIPEVNAGGTVKLIQKTAVDNIIINQNITKIILNGQLMIIKNGVYYNAQGQVIK